MEIRYRGGGKARGEEESGLPVTLLSDEIFDIDVHAIPARKDDPAHEHFDTFSVAGPA